MTMPSDVPPLNRRPQELQATYECVPNIGPRGRRWRALLSVAALLAGVAGTIAFMAGKPEPIPVRLLLGIPLLGACLFYFQVREKT
jgi:hypothetical protein